MIPFQEPPHKRRLFSFAKSQCSRHPSGTFRFLISSISSLLLLQTGTVSIFEAVYYLFFQHGRKNITCYLVKRKGGKSHVNNRNVCSDCWSLCHVLYHRICTWSARYKNKKVEDSYWIESDFGKRIIKCIQ